MDERGGVETRGGDGDVVDGRGVVEARGATEGLGGVAAGLGTDRAADAGAIDVGGTLAFAPWIRMTAPHFRQRILRLRPATMSSPTWYLASQL